MRIVELPMPKADALATIAYCVLSARGQANTPEGPTLHDIASAVVQAAPLLEMSADPGAVDIELAATSKLIERHRWSNPTIVKLTGVNGHDHRTGTTTPRADKPAGR